MASPIIAADQRIYKAHQQDTLLSEVESVIAVLLPRSIAVTGFGKDGNALVIHYSDYAADRPEWDIHFFEQKLVDEPLLALPQQAKAVFAGGEQQMLIPAELYNAAEAAKWLRSLYPLLPDDSLVTYEAADDHAYYLIAIPDHIRKLATRYLPAARLLPLAACQFHKPDTKGGALLQCVAGPQEIIATLRRDGAILWHQVFAWHNVADIAWQFTYLCKSHHIDTATLRLETAAMNDNAYEPLQELETYFPMLQWPSYPQLEEKEWGPALFLMQQLYTCAL